MTRILATLFFFVFSARFAQAHIGHVGDLAGHAHWVGVAAVLGAAAIAALAAKAKSKAKEDVDPADADGEAEDNAEGASA